MKKIFLSLLSLVFLTSPGFSAQEGSLFAKRPDSPSTKPNSKTTTKKKEVKKPKQKPETIKINTKTEKKANNAGKKLLDEIKRLQGQALKNDSVMIGLKTQINENAEALRTMSEIIAGITERIAELSPAPKKKK